MHSVHAYKMIFAV